MPRQGQGARSSFRASRFHAFLPGYPRQSLRRVPVNSRIPLDIITSVSATDRACRCREQNHHNSKLAFGKSPSFHAFFFRPRLPEPREQQRVKPFLPKRIVQQSGCGDNTAYNLRRRHDRFPGDHRSEDQEDSLENARQWQHQRRRPSNLSMSALTDYFESLLPISRQPRSAGRRLPHLPKVDPHLPRLCLPFAIVAAQQKRTQHLSSPHKQVRSSTTRPMGPSCVPLPIGPFASMRVEMTQKSDLRLGTRSH